MLYHLWTEAYLGRWIPLDATRGQGRCAPCSLALARWDQPEDGLGDFYVTMSRLGGRVEVEVVTP
jgi:transglutaminase-like putative cysteine protease